MPQFKFNIETLKTVARLCSDDETRWMLRGVHCVMEPGEPVRLEASDGRRLIRHVTDWQHDADAATEFVIRADAINDTPAHRGYNETVLTLAGDTVSMAMCDVTVSSQIIQGNYPTYKNVIPDPLPTDFPSVTVALNGEFLGEMLEIMHALCIRTKALRITCEGELKPLCFIGKNTLGMIMPIRINLP